jgi:hypothetical protein
MQYLRDNPALVDEITRKILEKRGLVTVPSPADNGQAVEPPAAAPAPTSRKRQAATE